MMHLCPPRRLAHSEVRPTARRPLKAPGSASGSKRRRPPPELSEAARSSSPSSSSDQLPISLRARSNAGNDASPGPAPQLPAFLSAAERQPTCERMATGIAASRVGLAALTAQQIAATSATDAFSPPRAWGGDPAPALGPAAPAPGSQERPATADVPPVDTEDKAAA